MQSSKSAGYNYCTGKSRTLGVSNIKEVEAGGGGGGGGASPVPPPPMKPYMRNTVILFDESSCSSFSAC